MFRWRRVVLPAVVVALVLAGCAPAAQNGDTVSVPAPALVPVPAAVTASEGAPFVLTATTVISGDADVVEVVAGMISARTGLTPEAAAHGADGPAIVLAIGGDGAAESYALDASASGVTVTGADAAGLFYGVQTLGQLIARDGDGWIVPAVRIEDAPRFSYRGVALDVARHFFDVETVRAYIDRAATLKFNALHLHLSDDQGWRLALDSRPELTARASGSAVGGDPGGFYTKADYADIVAYAAERHMIVVPEFDTPGHTHAVGLAYPELAEDPVLSDHIIEIARDYGGELPTAGVAYDGMAVGFSSLKIRDDATYDFLADVFGELAEMTPGPYLHVGGDEALGTDPEDFSYFMGRVTTLVADLGKTPVAWHEAGAAASLSPGTIGQYWGFVQPVGSSDIVSRAIVQGGGRLILSPADAIYLDMKYDERTPLGLTWANGPTSVQRAYEWDPAAVIGGVDESDILGVEAPLWTETVRTLDDIDAMAFPRIATAAEAAWSPSRWNSDQRTWESFRTRVGSLGPLWAGLGIRFFPSDEIAWQSE